MARRSGRMAAKRNAVEQAASLINISLPTIDELSSIDPKTARLKEVADAYRKYGVPMIQSYTQACRWSRATRRIPF